jgi:hypothetical protein
MPVLSEGLPPDAPNADGAQNQSNNNRCPPIYWQSDVDQLIQPIRR